MNEGSWRTLLATDNVTRLALICLGIWLNAADSLVTSTIMPSIARDIGGYAFFAWPVAGFALGAIVGGAVAGWSAHRYGLRFAQVLAAFVYAGGCFASAVAPTIGVFIAGRVFQGMGAGAIVGTCYFAINAIFPANQWRRVLAALSGVWGVATILGPLLGGLFSHGEDWRSLFFAFAGQALIFAAATMLLLPGRASEEGTHAVPFRTLSLLVTAIGAILSAGVMQRLVYAAPLGFVGVVLLLWAFRADRRSSAHLFPPQTTDLRSVSGLGYASIFSFSVASVGFTVYGAVILQTLYGLAPLEAGYVIAVEAAAWTIAALVVSEFPQARDKFCIRLGAAMIALSIAALAFTMPSGSLVLVLATAWILGAGFGTSWAYFSRHILDNLPESDRPLGSSAIPASQLLGSTIGSAICGMAANASGAGLGIERTNARAIATFVFVAVVPVAVFGLICAWRTSASGRTASVLASA